MTNFCSYSKQNISSLSYLLGLNFAGAIKICCTCKGIGNLEMKKKMIPIDNEVHCVGAPPFALP